MAKPKEVNIVLLGCGKLGQGIYKLLHEKRKKIQDQTGINLNIKHILVEHINQKRPAFVPQEIVTDDIKSILNDPSINIAIDAIGGIEPTYGIIKEFLLKKCHVVSANRALLASKMREIFDLARSKGVHLQFDAALGGGIPIIRLLKRDLIASRIVSLWGIASGTSNFILSEMHRSKKSLKEVLTLPHLRTISESHMLLDYEGSDSAQKLALLAAMAFGVEVDYLKVYAEGISGLKKQDIQFAEDFGYQIKLLTILRDQERGLELRVHPTLVPASHPLTSVQFDYNAVYIQTDNVGQYMLYGKGAGVYPAANMIIRDLVEITTTSQISARNMYEYPLWNERPVLPIDEIISGYYLRFICLDVPGVMGKIATVLGEHHINIESAHASVLERKNEPTAGVHIFIEAAHEKDINAALIQIKKFKLIRGRTTVFRILSETSVENHQKRI
jgi:homoserine dehydrogenase